MAAVVIGTAGHIDHGKTTLLEALTGTNADRLPEERRRGMTIDVGYAHLALDDGRMLDFVDVPGHERLVGNMLVGAGEIDAVLLVVAADDGPRTQTLEHLELLDALGLTNAVVALTKVDRVDERRLREARDAVRAVVARTRLADPPIVPVAAPTGEGLADLRAALADLAARDLGASPGEVAAPRLAIDRVFRVRGRGVVITGTLSGGTLRTGDRLRVVPEPEGSDGHGREEVRIREIQVHGEPVAEAGPGRTALLLGGVDADDVRRGMALTTDARVTASSRLLVTLRPVPPLRSAGRHPASLPPDRARLRLHLGTDQVDSLVVRNARDSVDLGDGTATAILRLSRAVAVAPGDAFALREPATSTSAAGGIVLDAHPPRGVSRRRATPERLRGLAHALVTTRAVDAIREARLDLHGAIDESGGVALARDVAAATGDAIRAAVVGHVTANEGSAGIPAAMLRSIATADLRRRVTLGAAAASRAVDAAITAAVASGVLVRDGDRLREAGRSALAPEVLEAMERLEARLSTTAPPPLSVAARDAGCPPDGVRALVAERRIVRLEDDLAWSTSAYRELARQALAMAARGPLSPAAFRDATGSSRRYVLAILEDLDRRGLLVRTPDGHRLGPRALAKVPGGEPAATEPR